MSYAETDYNNILCEAIDTIVGQRIKAISFDDTIICTIIDDTNREAGEYRVLTEGEVEFLAYSEKTKYRKKDQVYVLIPKGKTDAQKMILSKYNPKDSLKPISYVSPFDKLVIMSDNLASKISKAGLAANGQVDKVYLTDFVEIPKKYNSLLYSSLGIRAKFTCALQNFIITQGTYGIGIEFYADNPEDTDKKEIINSPYIFSNKDMFGNTYAYAFPIEQEKTFIITNLQKQATSFKIYLFQDKKFKKKGEEEYFSPAMDGENEIKNIFVNDIELYFCNDVSLIEDNTFRIYCNDLTYKILSDNPAEGTRTITSIWYNKDLNNKYLGYSDAEGNPSEFYSISWQHLVNGNWVEIPQKNEEGQKAPFYTDITEKDLAVKNQTIEIELGHEVKFENIRAVLKRKDTLYYSQVLVFNNLTITENNMQSAATIEIRLGERAYSSYLYEESNLRMVNPENLKNRQLKMFYTPLQTNLSAEEFLKKAKITWYIPAKETLVVYAKEIYDIDNSPYSITYYNNEGEIVKPDKADYIGVTTNNEKLKAQFYFDIKHNFHYANRHNVVYCTAEIDDFIYKAFITFSFAAKGMMGTDYTLVIRPTGNTEQILAIWNEDGFTPINMQAELYAPDGKPIPIGTSNQLVHWTWRGKPITEETSEAFVESNKITLTPNKEEGISGYCQRYNILTASTSIQNTFEGGIKKSVTLKKTIAVPYSISKGYYCGADPTILYDGKGSSPKYSKSLYLYNADNDREEAIWSVIYHKNFYPSSNSEEKPMLDDKIEMGEEIAAKIGESYLPTITKSSDETGEYMLHAPVMYIPELKDRVSILAKDKDGTILWQQPSIILQNLYSSPVLNDWGGNLIVDKDENRILTAMVGAGRKESDNTFSGVLMGEIGKVEGDNKNTGLYGFHHGASSFGLNVDGTAYMGKPGKGRIEINGDKGTITSGNYKQSTEDSEGAGMKINLGEGHIDAYNLRITGGNNLEINSNPNSTGAFGGKYYLLLKDKHNPNLGEISYDNNGNVKIIADTLTVHTPIGGDNLLLNSEPISYTTTKTETIKDSDGKEKEKVTEVETWDFDPWLLDTDTELTAENICIDNEKTVFKFNSLLWQYVKGIEKKTLYTFSGYIKGDAVELQTRAQEYELGPKDKYTYIHWTFESDDSGKDWIGIKPKGECYLWHPKVEKGTNHTAWGRNAEDLKNIRTQDNTALDQKKIWSKLSNGGTVNGMWLKDRQLYINATYIATGVLSSTNDNIIFDLNKGEFSAKKFYLNAGDENCDSYISLNGGAWDNEKTSEKGIYLGPQGINVGKSQFYVTNTGNMTAKSATISGGTITNGKLTINPNGSINSNGGKFVVDENGNMTATSATVSGAITNGQLTIGKDGSINSNNGKFVVDKDGNMTTKSATINGGTITNGKLTINPDGSIDSNSGNFTVSAAGEVTAKGIAVTNGTFKIGTDGSITNGDFIVSKDGHLSAKGASISGSIEASSGIIGGWKIVNEGEENYSEQSFSKTGIETGGENVSYTGFYANYPGSQGYRIAIGSENKSTKAKSFNFTVNKWGYMTCTGATINDGNFNSISLGDKKFVATSTTINSFSLSSYIPGPGGLPDNVIVKKVLLNGVTLKTGKEPSIITGYFTDEVPPSGPVRQRSFVINSISNGGGLEVKYYTHNGQKYNLNFVGTVAEEK